MKKRVIIYVLVAFGIAVGYLPLSFWLFSPGAAQAQACFRYFLQGSAGSPVSCGAGNTKVLPEINTAYSGSWPRYVALCYGP